MRLIILLLSILPNAVFAAAWCEMTEFTIDAYDHGGTYIKGKLNENDGSYVKSVSYIVLAGSTEDATNRRMSVALAAQMSGKSLEIYFKNINTCSEFPEYMAATTVRIKL